MTNAAIRYDYQQTGQYIIKGLPEATSRDLLRERDVTLFPVEGPYRLSTLQVQTGSGQLESLESCCD